MIVNTIEKSTFAKKDGTQGTKTTVTFQGDKRYFGFFDAFPFHEGDDIDFTIKQSGKYWNGSNPILKSRDPLNGSPYQTHAEKVTNILDQVPLTYERPKVFELTLDQLIAERAKAAQTNANPAYIGQLDNLIIQEKHHQAIMTYLGAIQTLLERKLGGA